MEWIRLYFIFFKVGLFTIGGGLAAIPLIQDEILVRGWLTTTEFANMIAVSESTPGPIGANVATYVGYSQYGILGSVIATIGLVTPSVIIIILIAKFVLHYRDNKYVNGVFIGLRPAVTGLILAAATTIALISIFDLTTFQQTNQLGDFFNIKALIMFGVFLYASNKWKYHPIFYIVIAGVIGVFLF
jgi:chromate transporter